jgi:peptidoglycan/LPS O-acetylase OafA/YrhL
LKYRSDIDGLRAVAVTAVVLNHAGVQQVSGGFFGVDIFFVISGYLISSLVLSEVLIDRFSIVRFYKRRCRRIVPALIIMLIGASTLAYFYLLPLEMEDFAKTMFLAGLGLSNFYFCRHSGYFDAESTASPLLHTWSLGVEEQFYLFFPALIVLAHRFVPRRMYLVYGIVLILSLACCACSIANNSTAAAFYLLPSRAWELALGALLSLEGFLPIRGRLSRGAVAFAGAALIAVAVFVLSSATGYLGLAALVPCLGTAFIIAAGRSGNSWVSAILSSRSFVFLGKISYSLYLWHWPIIVFHRMGFLPSSSSMDLPIVVGLSFVAAVISWKYVEAPFRRKESSDRLVITIALSGLAATIVGAACIYIAHGLTFRFSPRVNEIASYLHYDVRAQTREGSCFVTSFASFDSPHCLAIDTKRKNYLVVGDSHAAHLWHGLAVAFPEINFLQATLSSCPPTASHRVSGKEDCTRLTSFIFNQFLPSNRIDGVILNATWGNIDVEQLSETFDVARRYVSNVVLMGPMVQYDQALPRLLAFSLLKSRPDLPFFHRLTEFVAADRRMQQMAKEKVVPYVSFFDLLCTGTECRTTTDNGAPLLYDYGHLTSRGAEQVAAQIKTLDVLR